MKMKKYMILSLFLLFSLSLWACASSSSEEKSESSDTESSEEETTTKASPIEVLKFCGEYRDFGDYSCMYMEADGDYLKIKIIFSNEDKSYFNLWEMTGSVDSQGTHINYSDCKKTTYKELEDGSYSKTVVYTNGSGSITNEVVDEVVVCSWHGNMSADKSYNVKYVYAFSTASSQLQEFLTIITENDENASTRASETTS